MAKKAQVVANEAHKLFTEQVGILNETFGVDGWEIKPVPETGWNKEEIIKISNGLQHESVVIISPIPLLLGLVVAYSKKIVYIFHNDKRVSKEVGPPNAKKIIHTVAETGWELLLVKSS